MNGYVTGSFPLCWKPSLIVFHRSSGKSEIACIANSMAFARISCSSIYSLSEERRDELMKKKKVNSKLSVNGRYAHYEWLSKEPSDMEELSFSQAYKKEVEKIKNALKAVGYDVCRIELKSRREMNGQSLVFDIAIKPVA